MLVPVAAACVLALAAPAKAAAARPEYLGLLRDYPRGARAEAIAGLGAEVGLRGGRGDVQARRGYWVPPAPARPAP